MTTYTVHKGNNDMRVVIALEDFEPSPTEGFTKVGSFTHGVDAMSNNETNARTLDLRGDHVLVAKAKQVLRDSGDFDNVNIDALTYLDRASNAPVHADQGVTTDAIEDTGGDLDPDVSTQLGGDHSEENDSEIDTTQNSETETVADQSGQEGTQERIVADAGTEGQSTGETAQEGSEGNSEGNSKGNQEENTSGDASENTSEDTSGETVEQLKERIAGITDHAELQAVYDAEKAGKDRSTAIAAIEARAAELTESETQENTQEA